MSQSAASADESEPPPAASATADQSTGGVFAALRVHETFRRLWLGMLAASAGQWMQSTALGWLALEQTDSKSFVGLVAFAAGLPFLLVSVPAGLVIDRFDRKRVLMVCQSMAAMLAVVVAVLVLTDAIRPWMMLAAAFLNGSLQAVMNPTQQSLVPRLVPKSDLTNAIGLMGAGQNMTRVVGPTVSGIVIGTAGTGDAFLLQAIALILALVLIGKTSFPDFGASRVTLTVSSLLDGARLVAVRNDLRTLLLLAAIPTFFVFPYISFLSVFARDILLIGPEGLGLLMAASGLGAVFGSLYVASRRTHATGRTLIIEMLAYSVVILAFAISRSIWTSLPLLVAAGFLGSSYMSANNSLIQHRISDEVRGRVISVYMLTWGLMPLGAMPMGLLAERIGTPSAVALGAAASALLTLALAWKSTGVVEI